MRSMWTGLGLAAAACAPAPEAPPLGPPSELAGRSAGAPQRCVQLTSGEALRVAEADRNILLYGRGRTIWINRLSDGCMMRPGDILLLEPLGTQLCRGDRVRSIDPVSGFPGPGCALGDFVPHGR